MGKAVSKFSNPCLGNRSDSSKSYSILRFTKVPFYRPAKFKVGHKNIFNSDRVFTKHQI